MVNDFGPSVSIDVAMTKYEVRAGRVPENYHQQSEVLGKSDVKQQTKLTSAIASCKALIACSVEPIELNLDIS